jgi:hypothetical protein
VDKEIWATIGFAVVTPVIPIAVLVYGGWLIERTLLPAQPPSVPLHEALNDALRELRR